MLREKKGRKKKKLYKVGVWDEIKICIQITAFVPTRVKYNFSDPNFDPS